MDYGQIDVALPEHQKAYEEKFMADQRGAPAGGEGTFSRLGAAIGGMVDQKRYDRNTGEQANKVKMFLEDVSRRFSEDPTFSYRKYQEMAVLRGVSGNKQVQEYGAVIQQVINDKVQSSVQKQLNQPAEQIDRAQDVGAAPAEVAAGQQVYDQGRVGMAANPVTGETPEGIRPTPQGLSRMSTYEPFTEGSAEVSPYATMPTSYAEGRRIVQESGLSPEAQKVFDDDLNRTATLEGVRAMQGAETGAEAGIAGIEATEGEYTEGMKDVMNKFPTEKDALVKSYKERYLRMRGRDQDLKNLRILIDLKKISQEQVEDAMEMETDLDLEIEAVNDQLAKIRHGFPSKDIIGNEIFDTGPEWEARRKGLMLLKKSLEQQRQMAGNLRKDAERMPLQNPNMPGNATDYGGGSGDRSSPAPEPAKSKFKIISVE